VLTFSGGTVAPLLGLGMVASQITIVLFAFVLSLPAAYFGTFGPQLGMRQMVQSRYSWGYFPACIACLLNALGMIGFLILNSILGGQTLSAVPKNDNLSDTVGIVIIAIVSLVVSFCGIKVLHWFERYVWIPVLICFIVLIGIAGTGPQGLHIPTNDPPVSASAVLGMGAIVAGYLVSWAPLASDVTHYLSPEVPSHKIFIATFLGFFLSTAPIMMLGAAFAVSASDNAAWSAALTESNGALFSLILAGPGGAGNFGRFLTTILALSAIGNIAATLYSFGLNLQTLLPFLAYVPRFFWPALATAISLPLAIVGANHFYTTLSNFTAILGYWASLFVAVVLMEHVLLRKRQFHRYDPLAWNEWKKLPPGIAALTSAILSIGIIVPSMEQQWYTGPIAEKSGDIAFEVGFAVCCILYIPLRLLERHVFGR
jgi:NCS1 nucleoside transporter family